MMLPATSMDRCNYKRSERDEICPPAPPKRPRTNNDAVLLFGDTEDIGDEEPLDIHHLPTSSTRVSHTPTRNVLSGSSSAQSHVVKYRRVLKHVPIVPYVPLTACNGERLYLRLFPDHNSINLDKQTDPRKVVIQTRSYKGILGVNFQNLRREAQLLKADFRRLIEKMNTNEKEDGILKTDYVMDKNDKENIDMELAELDVELWGTHSVGSTTASISMGIEPPQNKNSTRKIETTLWVEKYKPKGYMDLLSEENINQELLHWLKLWDNCVFGRDYLARHKEIKQKFAKLEEKERGKESWKKDVVQDDAYDEFGRPQQKIVLLHGPAGLGKTTAAHVIAKLAGYKVVEVNASDDRSVDVFRKILDSTTQSRSEMFQDGRPNCLIVDEIDGSPLATVEVLVKLVSGKAEEAGKTKKKKVLRRPIICICNELYVPTLKNLRQVALVLQFHPIPISSLVSRIEEISRKENMPLDNGTLHCIAEKSECDIRSCLSTLQFIKQRSGNITHVMLKQLGSKDKCKGIFAVWEDIFFLPDGKTYYNKSDSTRSDARFASILSTVQNFGDYEKLQGGVYENFLKARFRDSYFETILKTLQWNIWFTSLHDKINSLQNYSMMGFLPIYFVANHFLCSGRSRFNMQYPNNSEHLQNSRFITNFKSQLHEMPATIGRFLDISSAILDVYPSMLNIIQPSTIRPIPSQLWSQAEKECVRNIVEIMLGYNLCYRQQRRPEGNYFFQLEPDIEELIRFPTEDASTNQQFPYTLKQIISREIEMEKMRQAEPLPLDVVNETGVSEAVRHSQSTSSNPLDSNAPTQNVEKATAPVPNWKQPSHKLDKDKTIRPNVTAKDFFGRPVAAKAITPEQAKVLAKKANASGIWYQYKEGFSNSVRKKLKVKDFL